MTKKTWQKSHTFLRKALYFIAIAVLISVSLLALPRSTQATDFNYTFDIKKNDQSVLRKTTSGNVSVGINMNSDKDLSNVRFYVDGKLKATRASIVNTGFREFYTWNTREESNGEHTVSIKAVKTNGQEFDVWTTSGNTSSKLTIDNGTNGGTGSGGGGNSGGGGGSGGGSNGSGGNSSSTGAAAEVTAKPKLTVEPGPMAGVAGSKAGTVNGDKVTGGIVFKVKFKRPKTENYDLKTIHVVITKDGQPRITIFNNPDVESSVEVKEEGDFKVYTFMRYYNTVNKPNGVNTWVATFQPSVPTPVGDTQSDPLSLNIDNPNSTAEQTCRELKKEVNNLFDTMTARIDKNQQEVTAVNDRIDSKYRELNLASTNPIPDYDAKKAANSQKSQNVDTKQTDLGALKIQCDSSANVEDVGEKIIAFKLKLEETKASMAEYRSATLDLLGDLRARLPQDGDDNGGPTIPAGFVKYNTPCYSFAARRGFTTDDSATQIKGPCNKEVLFTKTLDNGNSVGGSISPLPWPITDGTLEQNVQQVKNTEIANGSEIIDEKSFQLDGRNAVRFVARKNIPVGTQDSLHVLVDSPYKVDGKDVGGYDIYVSGYSFTGSPLNVQLGNLVKDATDKALVTWRWKDAGNGGGGSAVNVPGPEVPAGFKRLNTPCYKTIMPNNASFKTDYKFQDSTHKCLVSVNTSQNSSGFQIQEMKDNLATAAANFRRLVAANGGASRIVEEDTNIRIGGHNAIKFVIEARTPSGGINTSLRTFVEAPTSLNGTRVQGFFILSNYNNGVEKDTLDKIVNHWVWTGDETGGGQPVLSAGGFKQVNSKCFTYDLPKDNKVVNVLSNENGRKYNCFRTDQYKDATTGTKFNVTISGLFDSSPNATARSSADLIRNNNTGRFTFTERIATVDGQPAIVQEAVSLRDGHKEVLVHMDSPVPLTPIQPNQPSKGVMLIYSNVFPGSFKDIFQAKTVNKTLETWRWKTAFDPGDGDDDPIPVDQLSKVACLGNNTDGKRVQVIYLKDAGQNSLDQPIRLFNSRLSPDDNLTVRQFIKQSAGRINREVIQSAQRQDGFRQIRFATGSNCEASIQEVELLPEDQVQNRNAQNPNDIFNIFAKLSTKYNLNDPNKKYLVFQQTPFAFGACGLGGPTFSGNLQQEQAAFNQHARDPNPATNFFNNRSGIGLFPTPCWGPSQAPGEVTPGDVVLHEFMHSLGAVLMGSPNSNVQGTGITHCRDENDVMCYEETKPLKLGVCPNSFDNNLLDCKGDDYFGVRPPAGSFLANNWNTANSSWMTSSRGSNQR